MKKFLALLLAAMMVVGLLAACGSSSNGGGESAAPASNGGEGESTGNDVPQVLFFYSAIGDYGFGDQGYAACKNLEDKFGMKMTMTGRM